MKKTFRIVRNKLSEEAEKSFHPYRYRIEVRHTIFFFVHWWSTPTFAPPHLFEKLDDAINKIVEEVGEGAKVDICTEIIKKN